MILTETDFQDLYNKAHLIEETPNSIYQFVITKCFNKSVLNKQNFNNVGLEQIKRRIEIAWKYNEVLKLKNGKPCSKQDFIEILDSIITDAEVLQLCKLYLKAFDNQGRLCYRSNEIDFTKP